MASNFHWMAVLRTVNFQIPVTHVLRTNRNFVVFVFYSYWLFSKRTEIEWWIMHFCVCSFTFFAPQKRIYLCIFSAYNLIPLILFYLLGISFSPCGHLNFIYRLTMTDIQMREEKKTYWFDCEWEGGGVYTWGSLRYWLLGKSIPFVAEFIESILWSWLAYNSDYLLFTLCPYSQLRFLCCLRVSYTLSTWLSLRGDLKFEITQYIG